MRSIAKVVAREHGFLLPASALLFIVAALSACTSYVEVLRQGGASRSPLPAATVVPQQHSLAVLDVTFDPPLTEQTVLAGESITMLAAVENQGLSDEADVRVSARLLDSAHPGASELLNEAKVIKTLKAGEMRIVRFNEVSSDLTISSDHYQLVVEVANVPGETDMRDNRLTYDVLLHPEN